MNAGIAIPSLMFMTLGAALFIAILAFAWHMRKRSNRKPMEGVQERRIDEKERGVPPRRR